MRKISLEIDKIPHVIFHWKLRIVFNENAEAKMYYCGRSLKTYRYKF